MFAYRNEHLLQPLTSGILSKLRESKRQNQKTIWIKQIVPNNTEFRFTAAACPRNFHYRIDLNESKCFSNPVCKSDMLMLKD